MGYMTDGLTFNTLRAANIARLPQFKNRKGELSHNADGSNWSTAHWLQAVVGELGELANVLKKVDRGDFDANSPEVKKQIEDELADVQTYLDILAFRLGVSLGAATISKFNEVSERVNASVFIRVDGSDWAALRVNV